MTEREGSMGFPGKRYLIENFNLNKEELEDFIDFLLRTFIKPRTPNISDLKVEKTSEGAHVSLIYFLFSPYGKWELKIHFDISEKLIVEIKGDMVKPLVNQLLSEIHGLAQTYKLTKGKGSIYLNFLEGEKPAEELERAPSGYGVFSRNLIGVYMVIMGLMIFLFFFFGFYAFFTLLMVQFGIFLFSDKIMYNMGTWRLKEDKRNLLMVKLKVPIDQFTSLLRKYWSKIPEIKMKMFEKTSNWTKKLAKEDVLKVFWDYGINAKLKDIDISAVDVMGVVGRAAKKLSIKTPKVSLLNIITPNAAATGPSQSKSTIAITTGLIAIANEDELETVVGHELGHIKNKDPFLLLLISMVIETARIFLFFTFFYPLAVLYFFVGITVIFFLAKMLEIRADLETIIWLGKPLYFADILKKLEYHSPIKRPKSIFTWFAWETHPPMYFRVKLAEEMANKTFERKPSTTLMAFKKLIQGFFEDLTQSF